MAENSIQWLVDNHVILSKVYHWDAKDLASHIVEVNTLVNQSDLPLVHTLWDFTEMEVYPSNLNDIRKAVQPLFTNERLGWVITVMDHQMIAFLSRVASSMYQVRYHTVKTMDEAVVYLQERGIQLSDFK